MESTKQHHLLQRRHDAIKDFASLFGFYICGPSIGGNCNTLLASSVRTNSNNCDQHSSSFPLESKISRSAASIIAERKSSNDSTNQSHTHSPSTQFLASAMDQYLYNDEMDTVGGAIIYVPSLDLKSPLKSGRANSTTTTTTTTTSSFLPSLGESSKVVETKSNLSNNLSNTAQIPAMIASVLEQDYLRTSGTDSTEKNPLQEATSNATNVEHAAAQNLGRLISYTRSSAPHAPGAMIRALYDSFASLLESRVKSWTLLLLRHSLSSGDEDSRARLMSLLSSNKIEISALVTTFIVTTQENISGDDGVSNVSDSGNKLSLPLNIEVDIDVKLNEKTVSSHILAKGTIDGKLLFFNLSIVVLHSLQN